MKAQRRLGLALSWPWITAAFLVDVVVLALADHFPRVLQTVAWWVGVAVAAVGHDRHGAHLPWDHGRLSDGQLVVGLVGPRDVSLVA